MLQLKVENKNALEEIDSFLFKWHFFIVDYWWRKKYNVPFNSKKHRNANYIDMLIEYREYCMINSLKKQETEEDDEYEFQKMTSAEIDKEYEEIDLKQFDVK